MSETRHGNHNGSDDGSDDDGAGVDDLSRDLLDATRRVAAVTDRERRSALQRRLIAITNSAKHDTATAARRLATLLSELDPET